VLTSVLERKAAFNRGISGSSSQRSDGRLGFPNTVGLTFLS